MSAGAGVLRSADSLDRVAATLETLSERASTAPAPETWQATNLHTVAAALVRAAQRREETRGAHWREDFPEAQERGRGHFFTRLRPDGTLTTAFQPMAGAHSTPAPRGTAHAWQPTPEEVP
jgi:L-aspartate oxidase